MIKTILKAGMILLLCYSCNPAKKESLSSSKTEGKVYDALVLKAEQKPIEILLPADIRPHEAAKIFSKLNGFIKSIRVDIGSVVKKGDLLAEIEAPELKAQLAEARYKKEAANARFSSSRDTYERIRESAQTPGVISSDDIEKAKNQMFADSASLSASQFYLNSIQDLNNYLLIASPYDGIITVRNLNIGDIVGNNSSKPIFEVENNRVLRIRVAVPEVMTGNALVSKEVNFSVSAYPGQAFTARFARKAGSIDISTRSEIWEFETENPQRKLQAGMYAEIKLKLVRTQPSFFVPKTAVVTSLEKNFVIRIINDTTQWVDVLRGNALNDKIEIFGSLNDKDIILLNANEEIKQLIKINIKLQNNL
jgi:membrane fusion protein (multidrug efflux system)